MLLLFSEQVIRRNNLWFFGDNFMAKSYRLAFETKKARDFFIKNNFEINKGCNSRFSSNNTNFVGRLVNTVVSTVNAHAFLPQYTVFVLDDDIIEFVKGESCRWHRNLTSIRNCGGTHHQRSWYNLQTAQKPASH